MNKSSKIIIALLVAIIVLMIGIGGYYVWNTTKKLNEQSNEIASLRDNNTMILENENTTNEYPENQSNNENKKSDSNSTTSINYSDTLSNYDKMRIAYSLIAYSGDFDSTAEISKEVVISTLFGVVDSKITTDSAITSLFDEYDEAWKVHEYDEKDVKKAAKDILDLELTGSSDKYNYIRYKNGKYYSVDIPAGGEYLTIKNISNNGDTYTFYALSALDSEDLDISEYSKYEVVIKDGVIKSGRKIK